MSYLCLFFLFFLNFWFAVSNALGPRFNLCLIAQEVLLREQYRVSGIEPDKLIPPSILSSPIPVNFFCLTWYSTVEFTFQWTSLFIFLYPIIFYCVQKNTSYSLALHSSISTRVAEDTIWKPCWSQARQVPFSLNYLYD